MRPARGQDNRTNPREPHDTRTRRAAGSRRRPDRRRAPDHGLLHDLARARRPRPARGLRDLGPPRVEPERGLHRGPHPRDHAGHLRLPRGAGHRRAAVHRSRHARAVRAGLGLGAGGAGRQRRRDADRRARPLHADPGGLARDPAPQPRAVARRQRPGRRHRRDAVAQPARRRRLQVQPAARRAGRHRCDEVDREPRQRADPRPARGRAADPAGARAGCRHDGAPRLPRQLRRRPALGAEPRRDP